VVKAEQRIRSPLLLSFDCVRDGGEGAAAVGHQMETRARHQSRQAFHELQRLHDDMGGAVFVRTLQLQHDLAGNKDPTPATFIWTVQ
jgi:hypothetical protein